jgi:diguanylate cyclase (GGDEF)-like protein
MARSAPDPSSLSQSGIRVGAGSRFGAEAKKRSVWGPATLNPSVTPHRRADVATGPIAVESATLLVVTDDDALKEAIDRIASVHLFEVMFARDASHALSSAFLRPPDAVVIELGSAGLEVSRGLRGLLGATIPTLFIAEDGSLGPRVTAAEAGASLFLARPIDAETLSLALRQVITLRQVERRHALVVAPHLRAKELVSALEQRGMRVSVTPDAKSSLDVLRAAPPDVVVVFAGDEPGGALDVCSAVRTSVEWQDIPVIVAGASAATRLAALRAGADDVATIDAAVDELALRVVTRAERSRRARQRFDTDALTGLPHRRGFLERVARSYAECLRHDRSMAIALVDVDHFKSVNDRYGHQAGDHVLAAVGRLLASNFRAQDLRGRWGGEEFVLAFPGETAASVRRAVRGVLHQLAAIPFLVPDAPPFNVTFSAGLASSPQDGEAIGALLRVADRRLYEAKHTGRARVVASG